ncbi:MAG: ABC transporter ATP-binding protein [Paracoccaceae bacterium]|nr:ABC transporter ATP-binding protein [Paracoccaceae bacterium]MDE2912842.1 ABC transporter ATP-binding protein [Paracoccaceae bacterium]
MPGLPVELEAVDTYYGDLRILKSISLSIAGGEFTALLGASGCGKTTLLRALAGFVPLRKGRILIGGNDISDLPPEKRGMAMMFQSYALWPHMNVARNIGYGLVLRRLNRKAVKRRVDEVMELVGLEGFGERRVTELSGGQRQRVALARALAINPPILLLDEPLSNLDARIRHNMRLEIRSLQKRLGITTILVTHDQEEALSMADRVIILDQGEIAQTGTPEDVYHRPVSPFVAHFVGADNSLPVHAQFANGTVTLSAPELDGETRLPLADGNGNEGVNAPNPIDGPMVALFHSEAATLSASGRSHRAEESCLLANGTVSQSSYLGKVYRHGVAIGAHEFLIDHHRRLKTGDDVQLRIEAAALNLFPKSESSATATQRG